MSLKNLLGDCEAAKQLDTLIDAHRLPHAVIIECKDKELADKAVREIAKSCVCTGDFRRPCGICSHCRKASQNIHPDIYTALITDKKQSLGVSEIRTLISDCYIKPNEADCKVYIIKDNMTVEAQNALLKILEEPPQGVQFIIAAESSSVLLQTILSRAAVFKIRRDNTANNSELDKRAEEIAIEIAEAIPKNIELPLMIATGKLSGDKALTLKVLDKLSEYFTLALEDKYLFRDSVHQAPYIAQLSESLRKRSIIKLLDTISQARDMLARNCNMNLLVTWLCAGIRQGRHNN